MDTLEEIARRVAVCTDCALSKNRTLTVPGEGHPDADILFIGEGPGYQEDQQGRPFVGPAGRFLDELLAGIGLGRQQVFIANMVKCRPPDNRDPMPAEISACSKYLDRQIQLVNPKLVVTLGRFSMAKYLPNESVSKARGRPRQIEGRTVYPIMHPAAALHRQEFKKVIEQDFRAIPDVLNAAGEERKDEVVEAPPQQLSMF